MTAQKYLEQYKRAVQRIHRYEEEYERESLLIDTVRSLSDNDGMSHGSNISKPTENKAVRLAEKTQRIVDARLEAIKVRQEVFDTIMELDDLECDVLLQRYIYLKKWEDVCLEVNYTWPTVRAAWHRGEDMIQEIIDTRYYI